MWNGVEFNVYSVLANVHGLFYNGGGSFFNVDGSFFNVVSFQCGFFNVERPRGGGPTAEDKTKSIQIDHFSIQICYPSYPQLVLASPS